MKRGARKLLPLTYSSVWSWDNLRLAYKYAAGGKRGKGAAAAFEYCLTSSSPDRIWDETRTWGCSLLG